MSAEKSIASIPAPRQFVLWTLVSATVSSLAALASVLMHIELWIMFCGFTAWFNRPFSKKDSLSSMLCLWLGMGLGAVAYACGGALHSSFGMLSIPVVVFFIALFVVSLRTTPIINNMQTWFLGMTIYFAAHLGNSSGAFLHIIGGSIIGATAGWLSQTINQRWVERKA